MTKQFGYKSHGLYVNSPDMITVVLLNMSLNIIKYYVCLNNFHGLWRTTVTLFTLAIETCLKTCLPRVNLRQITLLRSCIHLNEQPVIFIP